MLTARRLLDVLFWRSAICVVNQYIQYNILFSLSHPLAANVQNVVCMASSLAELFRVFLTPTNPRTTTLIQPRIRYLDNLLVSCVHLI